MTPKEYPAPAERFRALEAMIFTSPSPVRASELSEATGWPESLIERDLRGATGRYVDHGVELQKVAGAWRMVTKAELSGAVERLVGVQNRRRLTRAQLETLAVVAYRQPVTRAQVESYRGVCSDRLLSQLSDMRLIREAGRAELPGRPLIYATTVEFLRYFGMESLGALPDMGELKRASSVGISASQARWNASARGETSWDSAEEQSDSVEEMPQVAAAPGAAPVALPDRPAASEGAVAEANTPTKSLRKLLDKIRGRSAATAPRRREEAS